MAMIPDLISIHCPMELARHAEYSKLHGMKGFSGRQTVSRKWKAL